LKGLGQGKKMSLQKAIGKVCARSRSLESGMVWLGHQAPGSRVVRSLCFHTGDQISIKDPAAVRTASTDFGSLLSVRLDEHIFRHIYFHGEYDPETSQLLQKLVKPGQIWLDVGGNVGFFTMLLSRGVGDTGRVYVFEPNPAMVERIHASLTLNRATNVELVPQAVSNESHHEISFYVPIGDGHNSGRASAVKFEDLSSSVKEVKVSTTSLDDYLERSNVKPDFMKIDIEGFEINAFRGMERTMRNNPPKLIISELNQLPGVLATPIEIISYLTGFDYGPYIIETHGLKPYVIGTAVDPKDMNFAFIQKNAADELVAACNGRSRN
jgi:FkbM family methyltransferase